MSRCRFFQRGDYWVCHATGKVHHCGEETCQFRVEAGALELADGSTQHTADVEICTVTGQQFTRALALTFDDEHRAPDPKGQELETSIEGWRAMQARSQSQKRKRSRRKCAEDPKDEAAMQGAPTWMQEQLKKQARENARAKRKKEREEEKKRNPREKELLEIEHITCASMRKECLAEWPRPRLRALAIKIQALLDHGKLRDQEDSCLSHSVVPLLFKMSEGVTHQGRAVLARENGLASSLVPRKDLVNARVGYSWLAPAVARMQVRLNNCAAKGGSELLALCS
jgi:hypothetical protein